MDLLLDLGNSRLKWAIADRGRIAADGHIPRPLEPAALAELEGGLRANRVLIACVAGSAELDRLKAWAEDRLTCVPRIFQTGATHGSLRNAYADPARMGVDRWLAMVGAWERRAGALVVADCGTATTLDCIHGDGRHAGGLIAPGRALMVESLVNRAPGIRPRPEDPDTAFPATDTGAAVRTGALLSVQALIERVFHQFSTATEGAVQLYLTGGDASGVAAGLEVPCELDEALVFHGMLAVAGSEH